MCAMTTYTVTTANWNKPAFWSSVSEATGGHTLDFSALPSTYTVDIDKATGRIILTDGTTTFTVGEAGYGGASDATLGGGTLLDYFETLTFGDGAHSVTGDADAETLTTGSGNDTIFYGDGADTVRAGDGDDLIDDAPGLDSSPTGSLVFAEGGNDTAYGTAGDDTLQGGIGDDFLGGDGGNDHIFGGDGADTILGGTGNDRITSDDFTPTGPNLIVNGSFEDTTGTNPVTFGFQGVGGTIPGWTDTTGQTIDLHNDGRGGLAATDGANWLDMEGDAGQHLAISQTIAGLQPDQVYQLSFDAGDLSNSDDGTALDNTVDVYWNGLLVDSIDPPDGGWQTYTYFLTGGAGDGSGTLEFRGAGADDADGVSLDSVELYATTPAPGGADSVLGGAGDDTVLTGEGDDTVSGGDGDLTTRDDDAGGNDSIALGGGNDIAFGEAGDDTITAGAGADTITGNTGADSLSGGSGNDDIQGGQGNDTLDGGSGSDGIIGDGQWYAIADYASGSGAPATTLTVTNAADGPINLVWIDGSGTPITYATIQPGETYVQSTFEDHNWLLEDEDGYYLELIPGAPDQTVVYGAEGLNDVITGGDGDDTIVAQFGDDTVDGGAGNDQITAGTGADTIEGGTGNDNIDMGAGDSAVDTVVMSDGDGNDTVSGFEGPIDNGNGTFTGQDLLDLSGMTDAAGNQLNTRDITVGDDGFGNALLSFPNGDSITLIGIAPADLTNEDALAAMGVPAPDDIVEGTSGNDLIDASYTGDPEGDAIDAGDNAAGTDDDVVSAGAGDDTIDAGAGADLIDAGTGDDEIFVDQGDTVQGGDGDDTFRLADLDTTGTGNAAISITGGEGDETNGDTLILTPDVSYGDITFTDSDPDTGLSGSFTMADGTPVTFSEIENIICFTPGTMILTSHGERPIETLQVGDLVVTRDQGLRPIRWIGKRTVQGHGRFAPIRVGANALDPTRKGLLVSPQHRILYTGYRAELLFGEPEVLVPAKHLVDGREVLRQPCDAVTYIHLMFDHHEVIYAEGIATESFHAGDVGLGAIAEPAREELFALFPELRTAPGHHLETARSCLKKHEAALLVEDTGAPHY